MSSAVACMMSGPGVATDTAVFTYDALGRIVSASHSGNFASSYVADHTYDAAGNRKYAKLGRPWREVRNWQDMNGDAWGDMLWRDTSGNDYTWLVWGTNGEVVRQNVYGDAPVSTDWKITGTLDFNGDGKSDILWRHTNGTVSIWLSTGTGYTQNFYSNSSAGNEWSVVGLGDFNGDGNGDVLWRHINGGIATWLSNGSSFALTYSDNSVGNDWIVTAVGDYNGDGKTDIVWRHSPDGGINIWTSNGNAFTGSAYVGTGADLGWTIVGMSDWNGDGIDDLFWYHTNGAIAVWQSTGSGFLVAYNGSVASDWKIGLLDDFNGDGKADIAFRHTNGQLATWISNGATYSSVVTMSVPTSWTLIPRPRQM